MSVRLFGRPHAAGTRRHIMLTYDERKKEIIEEIIERVKMADVEPVESQKKYFYPVCNPVTLPKKLGTHKNC